MSPSQRPPPRAETQKSWGGFFRKGFGKVQKVLQVGQLPACPVLTEFTLGREVLGEAAVPWALPPTPPAQGTRGSRSLRVFVWHSS